MVIGCHLVAKIAFTTANPPVASGDYRAVVARTNIGRYAVTLDEQLDATEGFCVAYSQAASGAAQFCGVVPGAAPNANIWEIHTNTTTGAAAETGAICVTAFFRVAR